MIVFDKICHNCVGKVCDLKFKTNVVTVGYKHVILLSEDLNMSDYMSNLPLMSAHGYVCCVRLFDVAEPKTGNNKIVDTSL